MWGMLTKLGLLDNQLSGHVPPEMFESLRRISQLYMSGNALTGPIPTTVGLMTTLTLFDVKDNQFNSSIPEEIGDCSRLATAELQNNLLTGVLPSTLGSLERLETFRVENNSITGTVPPSVCDLANNSALAIYADCEEVACPCCTGCF
mmetsp:Transcript_2698/g.6063  ORF Transcript_2698/g.6063 Transcript_2698/m.6063 type:complete len:148 (+) Transcript_2698:414-857(+)